MFDIIYVLEMTGVIAFAISGMLIARSKNMDPVGVFTIGFVTALGGGTLRDLMMDNHPLYWIKHQEQPILILCMAVVFSYWHRVERIRESRILLPDALGPGVFSRSSARSWLWTWATPGSCGVTTGRDDRYFWWCPARHLLQ